MQQWNQILQKRRFLGGNVLNASRIFNKRTKGRYKSFPTDLTIDEIAKCFLLDNQEKNYIYRLREDHNQLGYAIQLGTVKLLGAFLDIPIKIPEKIILYVSKQLRINNNALSKYSSKRTLRRHTQEIKEKYGYHEFSEQPYHWRIIRHQVTYESPTGFLKTIERYKKFYSFGAYKWDISKFPFGKIKILSRYASIARAQTVERMTYKRRLSTLTAFAIMFTVSSQDNVVEYMIKYFSELFNKADRETKKERLRTLKNLDNSARKLSQVCGEFLLNKSIQDNEVRKIYWKILSMFNHRK